MERLDEIAVRLAGISDPGRLLQGIFAYAPFGLQVYRADGHCLLTNKAFRDLFGSEPPPEYNVLHDEIAERQGLLGLVTRAFAGETVQTPTFWYDPRDLEQVHVTEGRRVAISITLMPLFGASGAVEHVALVIKDQTEETLARERAEAARADAEGLAAQRAEQERWLQTVLDQMPMPLIFVEPKTARMFFANAAAERMAGGALPRPAIGGGLPAAVRRPRPRRPAPSPRGHAGRAGRARRGGVGRADPLVHARRTEGDHDPCGAHRARCSAIRRPC